MTQQRNTIDNYLPPLTGVGLIGVRAAAGLAVVGAFRRGLIGCYVDATELPEWARRDARCARDKFRGENLHGWRAEDEIAAGSQGQGRGRRAVHFQHAMAVDPTILHGSQDYNNCTSWCFRVAAGCAIATDLVAHGRQAEYVARPGTAGIYSYRGHRSDSGMAIYLGAEAIHQHGVGLQVDYPGVANLSTEDADEKAGVAWGGNGPPAAFREAVAGLAIEQASEVTDEEAILDILYAGHFIGTGSTLTAAGAGDPVSRQGPIGGHAQALIGYDDTDEFRDWYRQKTGETLTDWVGIFDQSWSSNWITVTNWPDHLWGPRPDGAFVLAGRDVMRMTDTQFGAAIACSRSQGYPPLDLPPWQEALSWM